MSKYKIELRQLVDYPRCRVYRDFFRNLQKDREIRLGGESGLFYYVLLCSYANYRTSYRRLEGTSYVIGPGEWIFRQKELMDYFRVRRAGQLFPILDRLADHHYIVYSRLGKGQLIKVKITEWHKFNTALEYNAPCEKTEGFFFVPVSIAEELVGLGKCSEMDILLDLWLHAVYRDERVQGSELGGVVYFRDDSGNPILSYSRLAERWGISKATVCRALKKLEERDYLVVMSFPGRYGSAIYLSGYLSTMFQISDVMLDKQEVALALELNVEIEPVVSEGQDCVSKPDAEKLLQKVAEFLSGQGLGCPSCKLGVCKLYELSGCTGKCFSGGYLLEIGCSHQEKRFRFEIQWKSEGGVCHE